MNHKSFRPSTLILWLFVACSIVFSSTAFADTLDAGTMLDNFSFAMPNLMRMVTAIGYVMGMFFVFKGILELKQYGESRTMMSQQQSLSGPLLFFVSGTLLLYLPSTVQAGMTTFWKTPTPYAYASVAANNLDWSSIITAVYVVVGFIGTISIIRGIAQLSHLRNSGQQNALGRALTHIIGGIFCVNLYQFLAVINYTLGLSS